METGALIFMIVVLLGLAMLSCWIRGVNEMGLFLGIPELLLSPFGIFRFIIAAFASLSRNNIQFDYEETCFDPDLVIQKIIKFLFFFYYDGDCEITKVTNIVTQIFVCIPVGLALSFCWFKAVDFF